MSSVSNEPNPVTESRSAGLLGRLQVQDSRALAITIGHSLAWAVVFAFLSSVQMPYTMVSLFKLGLVPALAIVTFAGAVRGPIAGLLSGFLGAVIHEFLTIGTVTVLGLPALAVGIMGLTVGFGKYDFSNGRSLAKLSLISLVGFLFMVLLTAAVEIFVARFALMVVIGFILLPALTTGIPTVLLMTPDLALVWHVAVSWTTARAAHTKQ